eukprot:COSAG02_NODE_6068_length_3827_cov_1.089056_3_plen_75_part_00
MCLCSIVVADLAAHPGIVSGDFFDGTNPPPVRSAKAVADARAKAKVDFERALKKLQVEHELDTKTLSQTKAKSP